MCAIFGSTDFNTYRKLYNECKKRGDFAYGSLYVGKPNKCKNLVISRASGSVTLSKNDKYQDEDQEYGIEDFVDQDSYQFLKYGEGQFFNNHMDDCLKYHRRISYSMYLNEDYEGGEINFPRYGLSIKPKAHDMVIFPAGYTFNHSVSTVTKGTRYCIVAWTK